MAIFGSCQTPASLPVRVKDILFSPEGFTGMIGQKIYDGSRKQSKI